MNYFKNFSLSIFSTLLFLILLEIFARFVIYLNTKNSIIFQYGFNKTILFKVADLSNLDFILISEKKNKDKFQLKENSIEKKLVIWVFGGSTTEGDTPGCGHFTSSWPKEIESLNNNFEVINYGNSGKSTQDSVEFLINALRDWDINRSKINKPDIIMWANKYNEWNNYLDNDKIFSENNFILFFQRLDQTFQSKLLSYFLMKDTFGRVKYKFYGHNPKLHSPDNSSLNTIGSIKYQISANIYKQRTIKAINIAKKFSIDFHIVSLFGIFKDSFSNVNKVENYFYYPKFYKYWFKTVEQISESYNINLVKTEKFASEFFKNKKFNKNKFNNMYFCDEIHHTLQGNILTAKIINDYLLEYYKIKNLKIDSIMKKIK